ncbi:hypothetical protein EDD16DRAFT_1468966 [Pisolithus croceorrhizus]|nr:hypothetical protein EV401DRAFT_1854187 [Pisolithus croceorrhizus]KAI6131976.1 hypothetical protein EDD16DRAFT_1468966 [Pisolithus croceorrhizus]
MLFKFTKSDILNSSLVHSETGALGYTILTRPHFIRGVDKDSDTESEDDSRDTRRTAICNKAGSVVAEIKWKGFQPIEIVIGKERISAKGVFGRQSGILSGNVLGIPTRFDTDYFWMALPEGLTLLDHDSNQVKGQFHTNSLRVGDRLIAAPIPGLGHDYLEFEIHPVVSVEELIVTFILVEVLRRSRFHPYPGDHDRPKIWRAKSLASLRQRLRRTTL